MRDLGTDTELRKWEFGVCPQISQHARIVEQAPLPAAFYGFASMWAQVKLLVRLIELYAKVLQHIAGERSDDRRGHHRAEVLLERAFRCEVTPNSPS